MILNLEELFLKKIRNTKRFCYIKLQNFSFSLRFCYYIYFLTHIKIYFSLKISLTNIKEMGCEIYREISCLTILKIRIYPNFFLF